MIGGQPTDEAPRRRVGVVGLAGAPNVGKSTLVNRLVGQKVCIVSDRPQTTRARTMGIRTDERMQLVLVDIPGILEPRDRFNEALMECAADGLRGCDLVLHLRDARRPADPVDAPVVEALRRARKPTWRVWNKIDRVPGRRIPSSEAPPELPYEREVAVSAKTGWGIDALLNALAERLPEGPLLFDPEQVCDRNLRFLAAELVREKLFRYLGDEIPYATATRTETFDENRGEKVYIEVVIVTEREAHKPIIIGQGGARIKKIGQTAREDIERLIGRPVYLALRVKVVPRWRRNPRWIKEWGLGAGE